MAGVRRHWRLASQLSPSLGAEDYATWFTAYQDGKVPACRLKQLCWLIALRAEFRRDHNHHAALRLSAAIWQLVGRIKGSSPEFEFNNSQII